LPLARSQERAAADQQRSGFAFDHGDKRRLQVAIGACFDDEQLMSALPPIADIKADIALSAMCQ